jgi:acetyl-CoA C-acetyltransferase
MRIGIIGFHALPLAHDVEMTREESIFEATKGALKAAGLEREDIDTVISASSDYYDGRTISNSMYIGAAGAYLKDETKAEEDGLFAVLYAIQRLRTYHKTALVVACTHSSTFNPHKVSTFMLDPLFDRRNELINDITLAALQASAYMHINKISEEDVALVALKNLKNASRNPLAYRRIPGITLDEIMSSEVYSSPIRELTMAPCCDGAAAVVLAREDVIRKLAIDNPVWIEGVGTATDRYIRDRDLLDMTSLSIAAKRAYAMAGVTDPLRQIDFAEVTERFAYQELMIYEALGLCQKGRGKYLVRSGVTEKNGDLPVNLSGGASGGDAITATGLYRLIEAAKLLRSGTGKKALVHSQWGLLAQKNIVLILGGE